MKARNTNRSWVMFANRYMALGFLQKMFAFTGALSFGGNDSLYSLFLNSGSPRFEP